MNDLQESKLEKEAMRFASTCGEDRHAALVQLSWVACAAWIIAETQDVMPLSCLKVLCEKCGFECEPEPKE